jgi:hypothetical protein
MHDYDVLIIIFVQFEKAKALSQGNAALRRRVDEAYQGHLVLQEDGTGELVELGRTDVALDVLAKKGDWDRLWEVSAKEKLSSSTLSKYVVMRCEQVRTKYIYVLVCNERLFAVVARECRPGE